MITCVEPDLIPVLIVPHLHAPCAARSGGSPAAKEHRQIKKMVNQEVKSWWLALNPDGAFIQEYPACCCSVALRQTQAWFEREVSAAKVCVFPEYLLQYSYVRF